MDAIRVRKEFLPIDQAIDQQARQAYAVIDQLETLFRKREYAHLAETQKQREYVAMRKEQIDQTV